MGVAVRSTILAYLEVSTMTTTRVEAAGGRAIALPEGVVVENAVFITIQIQIIQFESEWFDTLANEIHPDIAGQVAENLATHVHNQKLILDGMVFKACAEIHSNCGIPAYILGEDG